MVHWEDPEGSGGEGGGRGDWDGEHICKSMADSCQCMTKSPQYCKKKNGIKNKATKKNDIYFLLIYLTVLGLSCGMWNLVP